MSAAVLAALAGVELAAGAEPTVPVWEGAGAATGPDERRYPVPASDGVTIDRPEQLIVVRFQQHGYVFNLACPHENTALRWKAREGCFQCPRHESRYQPDGSFISGRATRNMDRFALALAGGELVVGLDRLYRSDREPELWAGAQVSF
jgi:Rieske Fe-S protein